MNYDLPHIVTQFQVSGDYLNAVPYGTGHINDTFLVTCITVILCIIGYCPAWLVFHYDASVSCPVCGFSYDPREVWDTLLESSNAGPWVLWVGSEGERPFLLAITHLSLVW